MKVVIEVSAYGSTGKSNVNDLEDAVKSALSMGAVEVWRDYEVSDILTIDDVKTIEKKGTFE